MIDPRIPHSSRQQVARELESEERIEWVGQPKPVFFTKVATGAFALGVIWIAATLFWMFGGIPGIVEVPMEGPVGRMIPLAVSPFIVVGVGLLTAPLWAYRNAKRTVYVVTDRRAIAFIARLSTVVRSFPPGDLTNVFRRENNDGSGDVIVGQRAWRDSAGRFHREELGFHRVPNAKEVEKRLHGLAEKSN